MKLIIAIVQDEDSTDVNRGFNRRRIIELQN